MVKDCEKKRYAIDQSFELIKITVVFQSFLSNVHQGKWVHIGECVNNLSNASEQPLGSWSSNGRSSPQRLAATYLLMKT